MSGPARKCTVCGQQTLGRLTSRAELLALLVRVDGEIKRPLAHPLPPNVQTYEQLEAHWIHHYAYTQGRIEALIERVLDADAHRVCWECAHQRRMAEAAESRAQLDAELAAARERVEALLCAHGKTVAECGADET